MKSKHTIYFNPKDGNENFEKPAEYRKIISELPPVRHVMEIKKYSRRRSSGANAYYWKIVVPYFMEEMGVPNSESGKNYMHYTVLADELRRIPDELRPGKTKIQETHIMTGSEFWKYIKKCEYLFTDWFNGSFPPPKSLGYDERKP